MPVGRDHNLGDSFSVAVRHAWLKEIAHRIYKHQLRPSPREWLSQFFRDQFQIEALLIWMALYSPKSFGECFGVAVLAAGTDLGAAAHRVPGGVGPFDLGIQ